MAHGLSAPSATVCHCRSGGGSPGAGQDNTQLNAIKASGCGRAGCSGAVLLFFKDSDQTANQQATTTTSRIIHGKGAWEEFNHVRFIIAINTKCYHIYGVENDRPFLVLPSRVNVLPVRTRDKHCFVGGVEADFSGIVDEN